jgi:hypothetical protein
MLTSPNNLSIMNFCANRSSSLHRGHRFLRDKRRSQVVAYVAFAGSVLLTLAAASALITSDLPLPLFAQESGPQKAGFLCPVFMPAAGIVARCGDGTLSA